jgi:hypothetical protein
MARTEIAPPVQPQTDARRSRRLAFGLTLAGAGVIALFSSLPEVDVSTTRFFMFVGGAVALAVGLLVVSWRMAAALVLVFTVAVAAEGPVRGDDAAAVRLLERTGLPSAFHPTARGFQGNGRAFPYRVFAGSTSSIDPEMVRIPSGFSRVPLGFDFASQIYGRPIQSGSSTTLREDGYAPIATWERTEPTGRSGRRIAIGDLRQGDRQAPVVLLGEADAREPTAWKGRYHSRFGTDPAGAGRASLA